MGNKRAAGLIYGPLHHHLDHLAVLCHVLQIPLIVTEEETLAAAQKYYPHLEIHYWDYLRAPENIVSGFEILFYSIPRTLFDQTFFFAEKMLGKRVYTIWCPHGNSDKGHQSIMMEALDKEKIALVYGPKMIDFLKEKNVFHQLRAHVVLGNYRYTYYRRNKPFYDQLVHREIPFKKTPILYAPTWQDAEKSSSFFDACPLLIEKLPSQYSLLIKVHPNLDIEKFVARYEGHPDVFFIRHFPPVFPLLDLAAAYIGDMSSIGYDFLTYQRPMVFLNQNKRDPRTDPGLYLFRSGVTVNPEEYPKIYDVLSSTDFKKFIPLQKEMYEYTFGSEKSFETLRETITHTYESLDELDLLQ